MLESTKRAAGPFLVKIPHKGEADPAPWTVGTWMSQHGATPCMALGRVDTGSCPTVQDLSSPQGSQAGGPCLCFCSPYPLHSCSPSKGQLLSVPVQQQELTRVEMEVFSSAPSLLGAASSLQSVTAFLQNGLCHPCRELKDTVAVCSDSSWAKMPSERCVLWAKCFSLWDWFRCITGVLSLAHTNFTLTLLTGLLLVYLM